MVPVEQYPEYNFVGRILGPRGLTAKQLEQDTGCKIMVRGKGSMRDKRKVCFHFSPSSVYFYFCAIGGTNARTSKLGTP